VASKGDVQRGASKKTYGKKGKRKIGKRSTPEEGWVTSGAQGKIGGNRKYHLGKGGPGTLLGFPRCLGGVEE